MSEYDIVNLEHETLVLVVTSTAGNGDPPENGEPVQNFQVSLLVLIFARSRLNSRSLVRFASFTGTSEETLNENESVISKDSMGPLSNVRFAVFALGSSSYPNFASFGAYVDNLLGELGGERILPLAYGDEMCGQELSFTAWAPNVFQVSCETFCLEGDAVAKGIQASISRKAQKVRLELREKNGDLWKCLTVSSGGRKVFPCQLLSRENLLPTNEQETMLLRLDTGGREELRRYSPGDHLGIFPVNEGALVTKIISRLKGLPPPNTSIRLQRLVEKFSLNGLSNVWEDVENIPTGSMEELLSRFLDIHTPPSPALLQFLSSSASHPQERQRLLHLATDADEYEEWRHENYPNLWEVLEEFESVSPEAGRLLMELPRLKPRFYSISSSPLMHPNEIHITVALVNYVTKGGNGKLHRGVCSGYLSDSSSATPIACFVRKYKTWELYHFETREMHAAGVLKAVHVAVSREPGLPKTYVQDLLKGNSKELYADLVDRQGHMYVCGDCTMAEDVYRTVRDIIQTQADLPLSEADAFLSSLREDSRYHEDIFGITLRTDMVHGRATTIQERSRLAIEKARRSDK
ncbi:unnamed protein product [Darwinula stevensoni]|uniref:nitric-oxide synthase (NADPH) n=1 Tax=Darwinula stevensoni TaxID=69355 RepID=A0A7R9AD74_9CRUS|nr:unnamed protein product [Darwinula stevensoni]CAG0901039.1 unnamed protein product [Darwinula stevensoni]